MAEKLVLYQDQQKFILSMPTSTVHIHCHEEKRPSKTFSSHKNDVQSVAVNVSKLDYNGLILINPRVRISEISLLWPASARTGAACHSQSPASSETAPQCTDHTSFPTIIFRKVV